MRRAFAVTLVATVLVSISGSVYAQAEPYEEDAVTNARIAALEALVQQLLTENNNLKKEVKRLSKAIGDLSTRHGNNYVPKIFANMDVNSDFRNEVMRTNQGRFVIDNKMGRTVTFYINGARWRIPPKEHVIPVPLGKLTVHAVGEMPQIIDDWKLSSSGKVYVIRRSIRPLNSVARGY